MTINRKQNRKDKVDKHKSKVERGNLQLVNDHKNSRDRKDKKIAPLTAKNDRQKKALSALANKQLVVLSGSAGTGKTELICWWGCKLWLECKIDNIIITRPYKHLGADYGSTKGNDAEKLLPFCMSILNKLKKYLGVGVLKNNFKMDGFDNLFCEADGIQIVPIEKIQGMSYDDRTLIIADELQNAEISQVKALATRAEEGCRILCAGDPFQTALKQKNGLIYLEHILEKYPTDLAEVIHFEKTDVVRGGLASHLVQAFEEEGVW